MGGLRWTGLHSGPPARSCGGEVERMSLLLTRHGPAGLRNPDDKFISGKRGPWPRAAAEIVYVAWCSMTIRRKAELSEGVQDVVRAAMRSGSLAESVLPLPPTKSARRLPTRPSAAQTAMADIRGTSSGKREKRMGCST